MRHFQITQPCGRRKCRWPSYDSGGPKWSSGTPLFVLGILHLQASLLEAEIQGGQCVVVKSMASVPGRPGASPSNASDRPCDIRQVTSSLQPPVSSLVGGVRPNDIGTSLRGEPRIA